MKTAIRSHGLFTGDFKSLSPYKRINKDKTLDYASARLRKDLEWHENPGHIAHKREKRLNRAAEPLIHYDTISENWWL